MFKRGKVSVGLYIGPRKISAAELHSGPTGYKLKHLGAISTPDGAIKNGFIVDIDAIAKAIRSLFSSEGIKTKEVFVALSGPNLVTRLIELPSMPRVELLEALKGEVESYAVLSGDEAIIDFYPLEEIVQEGVSKTRVLAVAVPKGLSQSYVAAVEKAKLKPQALDIVLLSAIRAFDSFSSAPPTMLVIVETDKTTVIIVRDGIVRFLHTIDFSSESLNQENNYSELILQLQIALNYYQRQFQGEETVEKLLLCVDNPNPKKLPEELKKELDIATVEIADPFQKLPQNPLLEKDIEPYSPPAIVALGLAMRGISDNDQISVDKIDLLPPERAKKARLKRQLLLFLSILLLEASLFVPGNIFLRGKVESTQIRVSSIEREIEKPTSPLLIRTVEIEDEAARLEAELNRYVTFIRQVEGPAWTEALAEINIVIPHDIWLANLQWQGESVIFKGFSLSQDSPFSFAESIASSLYFASANLISMKNIKQVDQMLVDFQIKARLK